MRNTNDPIPTKQRILNCAASLFAAKGYTETSIRELASAAGLQGSSIYNHFRNKIEILNYMLDDYVKFNSGAFIDETARLTLEDNPTADGILACLQIKFPEGLEDYYFKVLSMVLQEQHRNPVVSNHMQDIIRRSELRFNVIMDALKDLNIIRRDVDPDFWMKMTSSLLYTFSNRAVLGNGDRSPNYTGMMMADLLKGLFGLMLKECGVGAQSA
jgi:AcrR family transcriptional regulator